MKKGFTLIELMFAVAIFSTLVSIAYPSYMDQMSKVRRSDAQGALLGLASAMERYFTEKNTYLGAAGSTNAPADTGSPRIFPNQAPLDGNTKYYNLTINSATATSYSLQASPIGVQANDACGNLTLSSTGLRNAQNNHCW